ncbi:hypothetical protein [Vibrio methylphosphonaticus]|uniref:hypothetical protein n=1 Tax=Vibrio methylphosphonaticus TaxID=2946866 RepID=UPI00202A4AE5|nr:hypothetical protein [Vibrio methylphosphonaticus]MCL9777236.1 hypothetical protein [Vibrio methylphosphonaticus]
MLSKALTPVVAIAISVGLIFVLRTIIFASTESVYQEKPSEELEKSGFESEVHHADLIARSADIESVESSIDYSLINNAFIKHHLESKKQAEVSRENIQTTLLLLQESTAMKPSLAIKKIIELSRHDLDTVLAWLPQLKVEQQSLYYQAIFNDLRYRLDDNTLSVVMEHFSHLHTNLPSRGHFIAELSSEIAKNDIDLALRWLNDLEQSSVVSSARSAVLMRWSQREPMEALEFILLNSEVNSASNVQIIQNASAAFSDKEVAQYLESLPSYDKTVQQVMMESLMSTLLENNTEVLHEWFSRQSSSALKDTALLGYLRQKKSTLSDDELSQYIVQFDDTELAVLID